MVRNPNQVFSLRHPALLALLAVGLLVSLAACGTAADTGSGAAPAAAATATAPAMDMSTMPPDSTAAGAAATAAPAGGQSAGNGAVVNATLREWGLDLSQTSVPAGPVHFVVTNTGRMPHNFTIKDDSGALGNTSTFPADQSPQTLDVTLKPGTYTVYCSLPGHAARGQQTTLIVK